MRRLVVALGSSIVALFLLVGGCDTPCRSSADCEPGELCRLDLSQCVQGCKSDADCAPARCDLEVGNCVLRRRPPAPAIDAGTSTAATDAGTATVADAG